MDSISASISAFFDTHIEIIWEKFFWVIVALFANLEAERVQNGLKKREKVFSNVNHNKLYFPILVSDQQVVKIVSPYYTALS
jgi:hypothetical protein